MLNVRFVAVFDSCFVQCHVVPVVEVSVGVIGVSRVVVVVV